MELTQWDIWFEKHTTPPQKKKRRGPQETTNTLPPKFIYFVDVVQALPELKTDQAINLLRAKEWGTMTLTLVYTSIY